MMMIRYGMERPYRAPRTLDPLAGNGEEDVVGQRNQMNNNPVKRPVWGVHLGKSITLMVSRLSIRLMNRKETLRDQTQTLYSIGPKKEEGGGADIDRPHTFTHRWYCSLLFPFELFQTSGRHRGSAVLFRCPALQS